MIILKKNVDIILPLFNKREYLDELIKSLVCLPKDFFNIIFVDDGSTDDSYDFVGRVINNNILENFFIFRKSNGGVSSARNYGLDKSKSKYIWFFDPDDKLHYDILNNLNFLKNFDCDVIVFNYLFNNLKSGEKKEIRFKYYGFLNKKKYLIEHDVLIKKDNNMNIIWNKWYKRELLTDLRFRDDIRLGEDRIFNLDFFSKKGECCIFDCFIYEYCWYGEGTLSSNIDDHKLLDLYITNYRNMEVYSFTKNICKLHIIDQIILRTKLRKKNLWRFYLQEHKKLNVKIFPFYSLFEFILVLSLFLRLNILFFIILKFMKNILLRIKKLG